MEFKGSKEYVSTEDLSVAVNAAINLEKPLLVKGEPGTGKTELARQISKSLNLEIIEWNIKSTTKAQQQLYKDKIDDISRYIKKGKIWQSFECEERAVLLIDEIDKADIEFPNDLLQELDKMEFYVYETGETINANKRPIVIITSNNEKDLPEAFLRRCFFHYINFPNIQTLKKIVHVHYPDIKKNLLDNALKIFFEIREVKGLKKKPSTSEALDWIKLLLIEDINPLELKKDSKDLLPKLHGALIKNEQDIHLFEKLVFMSRGQN